MLSLSKHTRQSVRKLHPIPAISAEISHSRRASASFCASCDGVAFALDEIGAARLGHIRRSGKIHHGLRTLFGRQRKGFGGADAKRKHAAGLIAETRGDEAG